MQERRSAREGAPDRAVDEEVRVRTSAVDVARVRVQPGIAAVPSAEHSLGLPAEDDADAAAQQLQEHPRLARRLLRRIGRAAGVRLAVPHRQPRSPMQHRGHAREPRLQRDDLPIGVVVRVVVAVHDAPVDGQEVSAVLVRHPVVDGLEVAIGDRVLHAVPRLLLAEDARARALDDEVRAADADPRIDALERVVDEVVEARVRLVVVVVARPRPEALELVPDLVVQHGARERRARVAERDAPRELREVVEVIRRRSELQLEVRRRSPLRRHPVRRSREGDHGNGAHRLDRRDPGVQRGPVVPAGRGRRVADAPAVDVLVLVRHGLAQEHLRPCDRLGTPPAVEAVLRVRHAEAECARADPLVGMHAKLDRPSRPRGLAGGRGADLMHVRLGSGRRRAARRTDEEHGGEDERHEDARGADSLHAPCIGLASPSFRSAGARRARTPGRATYSCVRRGARRPARRRS